MKSRAPGILPGQLKRRYPDPLHIERKTPDQDSRDATMRVFCQSSMLPAAFTTITSGLTVSEDLATVCFVMCMMHSPIGLLLLTRPTS